ncbi:MAG: cytochrome b/b6 domain-containing protein [Neomegalonema sp.]|nr:cytochrome b/b6 domain-containing protein [Neomegalonema sp.]
MADIRIQDGAPKLERIWDPIVRLTHWVMVVSVLAGYFIGENMSFSTISWHFYLGYTTGGVIVVRLLWGLFGPKPARIASLFSSPKTLTAYAATVPQRKPSYWPGHNPLGALSALALWLVLLGMVVTGLMSESDDFFTAAPFAGYLDDATRIEMTGWHHRLSALVLPLIGLHLAAILFYFVWKRENLVRPMITGWKQVKR